MNHETLPLLQNGPIQELSSKRKELYFNFYLMSIFLAIDNTTLLVGETYSTTILGARMGSYGIGIIYLFYGLFALCLARPIISTFGAKNSLFIAGIGNIIYLTGLTVASIIGEDSTITTAFCWIISLTASVFGGAASGLLWTAQGRYYAIILEKISAISPESHEEVNSLLAGQFAAIILVTGG
jgi:hypothetical protein